MHTHTHTLSCEDCVCGPKFLCSSLGFLGQRQKIDTQSEPEDGPAAARDRRQKETHGTTWHPPHDTQTLTHAPHSLLPPSCHTPTRNPIRPPDRPPPGLRPPSSLLPRSYIRQSTPSILPLHPLHPLHQWRPPTSRSPLAARRRPCTTRRSARPTRCVPGNLRWFGRRERKAAGYR
jgi:hypothetical protein